MERKMGKRKYKEKSRALYANLVEMSTSLTTSNGQLLASAESRPGVSDRAAVSQVPSPIQTLQMEVETTREQPRMGKFRFQLLAAKITEHFEPGRVADIGGGKGLLAYLLQKHGWAATVIDPEYQPLPDKYKDLATQTRVRIAPVENVSHINEKFVPAMALNFDLLVGMHAHGCNVEIINAAAEYKRNFVLFPCCIIDEPIHPLPGVHWLQCLVDYAIQRGFQVHPFRLNFSGQNIGFYARASRPE
jgi:hypothetical protein